MTDKPKLVTRTNIILLVILVAVMGFLFLKPKNMHALIISGLSEPMLIGWEYLPEGYDETRMKKEFHYLRFRCFDNKSQPILGDRACMAYIKSMNEIPATDVVFFSKDKEISHIRVVLKDKYHKAAYDRFVKKFGAAQVVKKGGDKFGNDIVGWVVPSGIIQMTPEPAPGVGNNIIFWTSKKCLMNTIEKSLRESMDRLKKAYRHKRQPAQPDPVQEI